MENLTIEYLKEVFVPIIIAIISTLGVLIPSFISLNKKNKKLEQDKKVMQQAIHNSEALIQDLTIFNSLKSVVDKIFKNTKADRFLVLVAFNGKTDMTFTSVLYEQHKGSNPMLSSFGAVDKYANFEFDTEYKDMLKRAEKEGKIVIITEELPACDLKNIYQSEGVKGALIFFLKRMFLNPEKDKILYTSVASHAGNFNPSEIVIIKGYMASVKTLLSKI